MWRSSSHYELVLPRVQDTGCMPKGRGYYVYYPNSGHALAGQGPSVGTLPGSPHAPPAPPGTRGTPLAPLGGLLPSLPNIVDPVGANRILMSAQTPIGGAIKTAFGDHKIMFFAPGPRGVVKVEITAESSITFSGGDTSLAPHVTLNKAGHVTISDAGVALSDRGLYFLSQQLGGSSATIISALEQGRPVPEPTGIALTARANGSLYAIPLKSVMFSAEVIKKNGLPVLVETTTAEITLPTPKGDITISYGIRSEFTPLPTPPHSTPIPVELPPGLVEVAAAATLALFFYLTANRNPGARPS